MVRALSRAGGLGTTHSERESGPRARGGTRTRAWKEDDGTRVIRIPSVSIRSKATEIIGTSTATGTTDGRGEDGEEFLAAGIERPSASRRTRGRGWRRSAGESKAKSRATSRAKTRDPRPEDARRDETDEVESTTSVPETLAIEATEPALLAAQSQYAGSLPRAFLSAGRVGGQFVAAAVLAAAVTSRVLAKVPGRKEEKERAGASEIPTDGGGVDAEDNEALVERLYRKLVAAKEFQENQAAENKEQIAYARGEMDKMRDQVVALQAARDDAARALAERDEEIERLRLDLREREREGDAGGEREGEGKDSAAEAAWIREECDKHLSSQFEHQADLLSRLRERTDLVYQALLARPTSAAASEEGEGEGEGLSQEGDGGIQSSAEALVERAETVASQVESDLWRREIEAMDGVNRKLHEMLEDNRAEHSRQSSELFFAMLSLKYEVARLQLEARQGGRRHRHPKACDTSKK